MATLDQSYTVTPDISYKLRIGVNNQIKEAVQFTPSVTAACVEVHMFLLRGGTPSGNIWVSIYSDNGSDLPNVKIGTQSTNVDVTTVPSATSPAGNEITFTGLSANLTASTKYWVVIEGDYTESSTDYIGVDAKGSGGTHINASFGASWVQRGAGETNWFKEYYVAGSASLSPSASASASSSRSQSPSASTSPSISSSPSSSSSTSPSISPSASTSSSVSPSSSTSPSRSLSPSASTSSSVSASLSPSASASSSLSPSASVSPSSSVSPSPSSVDNSLSIDEVEICFLTDYADEYVSQGTSYPENEYVTQGTRYDNNLYITQGTRFIDGYDVCD